MKAKVMLTICLCLLVAGCEEYAGGIVTGAAAYKKLMEDAEARALNVINEVNAKTAELEAQKEILEETGLVSPEMKEAIESLKGREKDPVTWVALASVLANMFWGGATYGKKRATP